MLNLCRQSFTSSKIQMAKTWLVQADLIFESVRGIDLVEKELEENQKPILGELEEYLEESTSRFYENENYVLHTRCLLYMAKVQF